MLSNRVYIRASSLVTLYRCVNSRAYLTGYGFTRFRSLVLILCLAVTTQVHVHFGARSLRSLLSAILAPRSLRKKTIKMSTTTEDPIRDVRTPNPIDLNYIRKAHWMDFKPESYNGSNLLTCLESIEMGLLIRNASYILDKRMPNDDDINRILMSFLKRALGDRGKYLLQANEDFPTSWKRLRQMHASKQKSELPRLERELLLKQQLSDEPVSKFLADLCTLAGQYRDGGGCISEAKLLSLAVQGLGSGYELIQTSYITSNETCYKSLADLEEAITKHDIFCKGKQLALFGHGSHKFQSHHRNGGGYRQSHGGRGKRGGRGGNSPSGMPDHVFYRNHQCNICKQMGHIARSCPQKTSKTTTTPAANYGSNVPPAPSGFFTMTAEALLSNDVARHRPCLDSGCNIHLTSQRQLLHDFRADKGQHIQGISGNVTVQGVGTLVFRSCDTGVTLRIPNVALIPSTCRTLISYHRLLRDADLSIHHKGVQSDLTSNRDDSLVARVDHANDLSILRGVFVLPAFESSAAHKLEDGQLWHRRLTHVAAGVASQAAKRGIVPQFSTTYPETAAKCAACACAKAKQVHRTAVTHSAIPLERIHVDLAFPGTVNQFTCVLTVIDDHSRYAWAYPLRSKGVASRQLRELIVFLQHHYERKCRYLHSDRGGEFTSQEFQDFLRSQGIEHETSPAGSPKSNGVIERLHGTIIPRVRAIIHEQNLSHQMWPHLIAGVVYVYNRLPSSALHQAIPFELLTGKRVHSLTHLRVLGCRAYYRIPNPGAKLNDRGRPGILVGYRSNGHDRTCVYRVYDSCSDSIVETVDVTFDETAPPPTSMPADNASVQNQGGNDGAQHPYVDDGAELTDDAIQAGADVDAEPLQAETPPVPDACVPPADDAELTDDAVQAGADINAEHLQAETPPVPDVCLPPEMQPSDMQTARAGSRPGRPRNQPDRLAFGAESSPPQSFTAAQKRTDWQLWSAAMNDEMSGMMSQHVFDLVHPPVGATVIPGRWVYTYKLDTDGNIKSYKARYVAKGFNQQYGIDFTETYAPTGRMPSLRALLAFANQFGMEIIQIDITKAFLNGDVGDHHVYLAQPEGYNDGSGKVWHLRKAIYGLKQAARQWFIKLTAELCRMHYNRSKADPALYVSTQHGDSCEMRRFLHSHVDDLTWIGHGVSNDAKRLLKVFPGRYIGEARHLLGLVIARDQERSIISLSSLPLIVETVQRWSNLETREAHCPMTPGADKSTDASSPVVDTEHVSEYRAIVGSLMYIASVTRPDLMYAASELAQHVAKPLEGDMKRARQALRYLNTTKDLVLQYHKHQGLTIAGHAAPASVWSDADYAGCEETRKSRTGFVLFLFGAPILWASKKQPCVVKSTTAAEYIAASMAADEAIFLGKLLFDLGLRMGPIDLFCDNRAAVASARNPIENLKVKYLEVHWHFIREQVEKGELNIQWVQTRDQIADIFTKPLARSLFEKFRLLLCVR
jgi:transposase InsO family protein